MNCFLNFSYRVMWFPWTWFLIVISNIKLHVINKLMECHWCQIFRVCICMSMLAIVLLLLSQILLRLKYNNLYEPKLHLERHIVKLQFVGVFLLSTTYLWMLKSHKCYDASFATLNNMMLFLFHQSFRMVLIFCTPNSFFWIFMMFILNKYIRLFLCRGYDISCSSFSS